MPHGFAKNIMAFAESFTVRCGVSPKPALVAPFEALIETLGGGSCRFIIADRFIVLRSTTSMHSFHISALFSDSEISSICFC